MLVNIDDIEKIRNSNSHIYVVKRVNRNINNIRNYINDLDSS